MSKRLTVIEDKAAKDKEDAINKTGDVEKITASLKEKHDKEIAKRDETISSLNGKINTHVVGKGLTDIFLDSVQTEEKPEEAGTQ